MRTTLLAVAIALVISILPVSAQAVTNHYQLNIPRQPLDAALKDLATQTGVQIARFSDIPHGGAPVVGPVSGDMSVDQAITSLLASTGLTYKKVNDRTIAVVTPGAGSVAWPTTGRGSTASQHSATSSEGGGSGEGADGKRAFWNSFLVAQADQGGSSNSPPGEKQAAKQEPVQLQEVIVTAQKRNERLQDVPVPVAVVDTESLADRNLTRLEDFSTTVPALSVGTTGNTIAYLAIRGVTTGGALTNPTVGVTLDDIPFGPSSGLAFAGTSVPDIDPSELKNIEVLRGPQGTLYGAASIGGLIKYVTNDPTVDNVYGRLQGDLNSVHSGDSLGWGIRGAVNVPVGDTFAVRLSGMTRQDPGYVDDPVTHLDGVNRTDDSGGRIAGLWKPADSLTIKLSALINNLTANGNSDVNIDPTSGNLKQSVFYGTGGYTQILRLYSAVVNAKLGDVDFTSVTGYQTYHVKHYSDYTPFYSPYAEQFFGVSGAPDIDNINTKKFSQEFRFSSSIGGRADWLLGGFYTHEDNMTDQAVYSGDPSNGALVGLLGDFYYPTTYSEAAVFADLTIHFSKRFNLQIGGREGRNRQRYDETDTGPLPQLFYGSPSPVTTIPTIHTEDSSFTYLVTPQFTISNDLMAYARVASGYRPGGPNPYSSLFGFPQSFKSDKTVNYEIGTKGSALNNALSFDASIYYITWRDIQVTVLDPVTFYTYLTNASSAKSEGVELSGMARPLSGLTVSAWVAWNEAVLASDLPSSQGSEVGLSGDQLPFSSRWSGNLSAEQAFPLGNGLSGFVGVQGIFVGERVGQFAGTFSATRPVFPAYTRLDCQVGLRRNDWSVTAFVNNVTDRRGVVNIFQVTTEPFYTFIQPRTVGLTFRRNFRE